MIPVVSTDVTDAALWRRAAAGEGDAFAALYLRHGKRIYNYLFRRLGDWSEAEDLLASVFLEAHRRRSDPALDPDRIVAWLFGVATILANNRRRSAWRRRRLFDRAAAAASIASSVPDAASRVEAQEQMRALLDLSAVPMEGDAIAAIDAGLEHTLNPTNAVRPQTRVSGVVRQSLHALEDRAGQLRRLSRQSLV